jgi:hypothetical protein
VKESLGLVDRRVASYGNEALVDSCWGLIRPVAKLWVSRCESDCASDKVLDESHCKEIYWASKLLVDRVARQVTELVAGRASSYVKPQSCTLLATRRLKDRQERAHILGSCWYTRFRNLLHGIARCWRCTNSRQISRVKSVYSLKQVLKD